MSDIIDKIDGQLIDTALEKALDALDDAVRLIDHLGGNPKLQKKAFEALKYAIEHSK